MSYEPKVLNHPQVYEFDTRPGTPEQTYQRFEGLDVGQNLSRRPSDLDTPARTGLSFRFVRWRECRRKTTCHSSAVVFYESWIMGYESKTASGEQWLADLTRVVGSRVLEEACCRSIVDVNDSASALRRGTCYRTPVRRHSSILLCTEEFLWHLWSAPIYVTRLFW